MLTLPKPRSKARIRWAERLGAAMLLALVATGTTSTAQAQDSWTNRWYANSHNNYVEVGYNQQDTDFTDGTGFSNEKPGYAYIRAAKSIANDKVYLFGGYSRASYSWDLTTISPPLRADDEVDITSSRIQIGIGSNYELNPSIDLIAEASIISESLDIEIKKTISNLPPAPPNPSTTRESASATDSYTSFGGGIYMRPDSLNNTAWWAKVARESRFGALAFEVGGQLQLTPSFSLVGQINTYDTTEVLVYGAGARYNF